MRAMRSVQRLAAADSMFLYGESREIMLHVASLMPFSPPPDAPPGHLRALVEQLRATRDLQAPWNLKLRHPGFLKHPLQAWVEDPHVDIDYHVRRSALPSPGDERELGILVSRLHSHPLDFTRPPWELHIIEGLENGRFALYMKVHHALVDGFTSMKLLSRGLAHDANEREMPLFLSIPPRAPAPRPARAESHAGNGADEGTAGGMALVFPGLLHAMREQLGSTRELGRALADLVRSRGTDDELVSPLQAPHSILNGPIGRTRRFATQQFDLGRIRAAARKAGGTVNDILLALSGASLRRFLLDLGELPDEPLVAMLPVNVRPKDDPGGGGNAVGAILASLATHIEDPGERLRAVVASARRAKQQLQGMSRAAIIQYSALLLAPFGLQAFKPIAGKLRPSFNVVVSNVPGPTEPLYFRGARLEAIYPMSIPVHGLALNITCTSYADTLNFGFIGCRETLPHMQRLAVYCGEAMNELEATLS
jgi:diacylglycerol O-acyltransferase